MEWAKAERKKSKKIFVVIVFDFIIDYIIKVIFGTIALFI